MKKTEVEITPSSLAKLSQALDYRFRIRGQYDEDGVDLMDIMGTLYKELAKRHSEAIYGPASNSHIILEGWPTAEELSEALETLHQFDMLKLIEKE